MLYEDTSAVDAAFADTMREELARRRLLDFAKRLVPGFEDPEHIRYLAGLLERVEAGEISRLAISAPPGHGKSTLLQAFAAWFLGRDERRRILAMSASESLAKRNSRATQGLVTSENWVWPNIALTTESVLEWGTKVGGGLRAIGKGGTVTGFRGELAIVDDLQADAGSDLTRESDEEWFRGVLSTRLEPGGAVVLIATRWHDADLIGRLQTGASAEQWTFVNLPAIAGEHDILERQPGEALWPERWPVEALEAKKDEVGATNFAAQYLGDPSPAGGRLFAVEWLSHRYDAIPLYRPMPYNPPNSEEGTLAWALEQERRRVGERSALSAITIQAIDSAWKAGIRNDRSVIATLTTDMRDIYVRDVWFGRLDYPDLKLRVQIEARNHNPRMIYVEEAASGFAIVSELRRETGLFIKGVPPGRDSKEARAESVTGWFEAGRVKFPREASWLEELMNEFLRFPRGRHDDIVDAVVLGIRMIDQTIRQVLWNEEQDRQAELLRSWMVR